MTRRAYLDSLSVPPPAALREGLNEVELRYLLGNDPVAVAFVDVAAE